MRRREIIDVICRLRRQRDRCRNQGMFERGMSAAYHLSAHILYREALESGVLTR
jgi:hypothetical protein